MKDDREQGHALAALRASSDFSKAQESTLHRLAEGAVKRAYRPHSTILQEGDDTGPAYLIESGEVWLTAASTEGDEGFVAEMGPGSLIGEMTALIGVARTVTATCVSQVIAWRLSERELRTALVGDAGLAFTMMLSTMELILAKDTQTVLRAKQSSSERVASQLLNLMPAHQSHGPPTLGVSHVELAMMTGLTRESVSRVLASLRRRGVVETARRAIIVLDEAALERTATHSPQS